MKSLLRRLRRVALLRPILYRSVTRLSTGVAAALVWDRFLNPGGRLSLFEHAFFVIGVLFAAMAWFSYLRLDGVSAPSFIKLLPKKQPKRKMGDMVDYVDEKVDEDDALTPDDATLCAMAANALCAVLFLAPSLLSLLAG